MKQTKKEVRIDPKRDKSRDRKKAYRVVREDKRFVAQQGVQE